MYAIIFAVKHFRPYVFGQKFKLVTDHRPLVWLIRLKDPTMESRLARWKIKLQEYDYEIVYKRGRVNANADALYRNPVKLEREIEPQEPSSGDKRANGAVGNTATPDAYIPDISVLYHEYPIERVFLSINKAYDKKDRNNSKGIDEVQDNTDSETESETEKERESESENRIECVNDVESIEGTTRVPVMDSSQRTSGCPQDVISFPSPPKRDKADPYFTDNLRETANGLEEHAPYPMVHLQSLHLGR